MVSKLANKTISSKFFWFVIYSTAGLLASNKALLIMSIDMETSYPSSFLIRHGLANLLGPVALFMTLFLLRPWQDDIQDDAIRFKWVSIHLYGLLTMALVDKFPVQLSGDLLKLFVFIPLFFIFIYLVFQLLISVLAWLWSFLEWTKSAINLGDKTTQNREQDGENIKDD